MRILITACPFHGHVNTVLPLARAARAAGHDVIVATGADLATHVRAQGLRAWDVGPTVAEAGIPMSPAYFVETAAPRARQLSELVSDWRPDLVVSEELELAGAVVSATSGAFYVVHGLGIAAIGDAPEFLAGIAAVDALGRPSGVEGSGQRYLRAPYVSVCPPSLRAPGAGLSRPEMHLLRPVSGEPGPGDTLPAALAALPHARTVHLTLGTVFHQRNPGVLEGALDAIAELPLNVVVTVGPGVDPASLGTQPSHVLVERYLPHAALLPRCDVVVSQGGAGILFGAFAHGLPQLVLPQGADQFDNADAAARSGAALTLDSGAATGPAIAAAVSRLLDDRRFRDAAGVLRDEIAAMPAADAVLESLTRSAAAR